MLNPRAVALAWLMMTVGIGAAALNIKWLYITACVLLGIQWIYTVLETARK